ncbi:MAG: sodium-dependent transporter [Muribaculaceae bacterium]|nr:sodium-dependent transporter [Muribaculaceae bacterium]
MKKTDHHHHTQPRARFATRIGAIAAAAGSAVGLGNIWRFPYEAGNHGGGAFILCYLFFIAILGIPVMCAEFIMGRASRSNELRAFKKFAPGRPWYLSGYAGIVASLMILSFYSVVAGWTAEYFFSSVTGQLRLPSAEAYHQEFAAFSGGNVRPLIWTLLFLGTNMVVLLRGVAKGIERISNLLMPVLFLLLVIFCINSLTLPGAADGLRFIFQPDFSQITPQVLLGAMGQAFFSLSIGLGCMMTYGSYFSPSTRLGRTATASALLDTLVALLAAVIIFPAVFSFGMSPSEGPTLVFEVLPAIFHQLPAGAVWSALFFFLLMVASITSTISMSEISISFFMEERHMSRRNATLLSTGIAVVFNSLCCLSFGCMSGFTICGLTVFDLFNYVSSDLMLPIGGMVISIFVGWKLNPDIIRRELTNGGDFRFRAMGLMVFCLRWIAPIGIGLVLLNCIGLI